MGDSWRSADGETGDTPYVRFGSFCGPFSADFRLVYLDGNDNEPIRCTKAQADVFRALWGFEGKDRSAEDVMTRAGRKSAKPIDVFKAHPEPKRAYEVLVVTNQKEGLYRMPLAAR